MADDIFTNAKSYGKPSGPKKSNTGFRASFGHPQDRAFEDFSAGEEKEGWPQRDRTQGTNLPFADFVQRSVSGIY